ncbi:MAG: hypothetical protein K2X38_13765 [Gemmataceae bacterium]|nr:hypothetical protein [Gemmataceae bacterium]
MPKQKGSRDERGPFCGSRWTLKVDASLSDREQAFERQRCAQVALRKVVRELRNNLDIAEDRQRNRAEVDVDGVSDGGVKRLGVYGSRVFFDALGKPWPKHPCTDNDFYRYPRSANVAAPEGTQVPRTKWREQGWRAYRVFDSSQPCLFLQGIEESDYLSLALSPDVFDGAFPVVFVKFESPSRVTISYFHNFIQEEKEIFGVTFYRLASPPVDSPQPASKQTWQNGRWPRRR